MFAFAVINEKIVLHLVQALLELSAWRKGVCAGWEQRNECLLLGLPRTLSLSENCVLLLAGKIPLLALQPRGCCQSKYPIPSATQNRVLPQNQTKPEVRDEKESFW